MIIRIKILTTSIAAGALLLLAICLGSQNLNDRYSINFGLNKTAPLPIGFIVGVSLITGILTGGSLTALLIQDQAEE